MLVGAISTCLGSLGVAEDFYRYRAFISYRHTDNDRKWARWLIEKLETFRTPSALVKRGAPARIGQIFRDDDEIPAANDLSGQIQAALSTSQFLIVVCSPATPKSKWVRREIEFFRSLGRGDRILALLIDGTPEESFPPELLRFERERVLPDGSKTTEWIEEEPLAADVRPRTDERQRVTERRAFLRIAAGLLGVGYDDLVQREKQREARKQRIRGAVAAATLLGAAAGGYEYWDYNTLHTRYYRDFGTRWGVPFGVGEIGSDAAAHRSVSYAIDTLHSHVIAMRRENGSHGLVPLPGDGIDGESWEAGVAQWRLPYPADRAVEVDVYGKFDDIAHSSAGNKLRVENFTWQPDGSAIVAFKNPGGGAQALQALDSGLVGAATAEVISRASLIASHRYVFSPEGYVSRKLYQTVWGASARDSEGSFGKSYDHNKDGEITDRRDLDAQGNALTDKRGIAGLRISYDAAGEFSSAMWLDTHGKPTANALGYSIRRVKLDGYGNRVEESFLDAGGHLVLTKDKRIAHIARRYDERGNKIEEDDFGTDGKPVLRADRGVARVLLKYDARGNDIEESYFDVAGRPVLRKDYGNARITIGYDANDNDIEERYFGTDGKLIAAANDLRIAGENISYDARGKLTEAKFFGVDGKLVLRGDTGFARQIWKYDEHGREIEEDYFDAAGKPVAATDDGTARLTVRYDERGNEIEDDYFGVDGKSVVTTDAGCARKMRKYDDRGDETEEDCIGVDNRPILRRDAGVARVTAQYNDLGQKTEERYFGPDGSPVLDKDSHAAAVHFDYNTQGGLIATRRYGIDGKLLPGPGPGG